MSTPLKKVLDLFNTLKSKDNVIEESQAISYCRLAVIEASISLEKDLQLEIVDEVVDGSTVKVEYIMDDLKSPEIFLISLYAYRLYMVQEHEVATKKAVNFKTINFAVSGMTEKAKEYMRIVNWCDNEINKTLTKLGKPMGSAIQMKGDPYVSSE